MKILSRFKVKHALHGALNLALTSLFLSTSLIFSGFSGGIATRAEAAEARDETKDGKPKRRLAALQREARLGHASELMGRHYKRSVVATGERVIKINDFVYTWVRESLPKKYRQQYQQIAQTIIDESLKHRFDPVFLMSVMQAESSFNPEARGKLDEVGLMQLRPHTAEWVAKQSGLPWKGAGSLQNPTVAIRLGTAYLALLRERFDEHARLYIAAYNMGGGNVRELLKAGKWPKDYPRRVMKEYVAYYRKLKEMTPPSDPLRRLASMSL